MNSHSTRIERIVNLIGIKKASTQTTELFR